MSLTFHTETFLICYHFFGTSTSLTSIMSRRKIADCPEPAPKPKTDFENWSVSTWECYGDKDGHCCEPCWKSPDYPDPLYTMDEKKWFLEVIWLWILILSIIVFLINAVIAPWPHFWILLLGMAVGLLISYYVNYM